MGFDRRLKAALRRDAESIDPAVEWRLERVRERGRPESRGRTALRGGALAVLSLLAVLIIAVLAGAPGGQPNSSPSPSASPSPSGLADYTAIAGTYQVTLSASQAKVSANSLTGLWTMTLNVDGAISISPPAGFTAEGSTPTGNAYSLNGGAWRTNMFSNDLCSDSVGMYAWSRSGTALTFNVLSDPCIVRVTLLTSSPWSTESPSATP